MEPKAPGITQLYRGRMDSWVMLDRKGLCFAPIEVPVVLWLLSEFSLQFPPFFLVPRLTHHGWVLQRLQILPGRARFPQHQAVCQ